MRVILVRHSKAAHGSWADADRPLTPAGEAVAADVAAGLAKLEPDVVRVVTSPAARARETGEILAHAWQLAKVAVDDDLAIGGHLERAVARLLAGEPHSSVLAVGHAPDLAVLTSMILGAPVSVRFKCCGAVCIEVEPQSGGFAVLEWAMGPEALAALGAP